MKLTVSNLTKKYKDKMAVDHINLEIQEGIWGLLGPNGAGKTTLLRMICDILKPTEGAVLLDGENIHHLGEDYREILGYLPQKVGYYPHFSAEEYLMYLACLKGLDKKQAKERTAIVLGQVSLSEERKHKISTFSGGMVQRLGIAQALLNDPKILILDEPTAGLDPKERIRFRNMIARLAKDRIVILSTHVVSDIETIATDIVIMNEGKVQIQDFNKSILQHLKDKVCYLQIKQDDYMEYEEKYLITSVTPVDDGLRLRMICKELPEGAEEVEPTLEDLYLSIVGLKI